MMRRSALLRRIQRRKAFAQRRMFRNAWAAGRAAL
jgi:hypothetical protein